jgi:hypothetical protein
MTYRGESTRLLLALLGSALPALAGCGCASVAPPPSQVPSGQAAIDRMRATFAPCNGVQAEAKIDHYGDRGRVRGNLLMFATRAANLRMDVMAPPPLMQPIATLTTDGAAFAFNDLRSKRFVVGPASGCNIARLTTVAIPAHALVEILHGEAPVLKHAPSAPTIEWSSKGYYVVRIPSTRDAREEIHMTPRPDDWARPWSEQRMRVVDVLVEQQGFVLYHAEMDAHAAAPMSKDQIDEAGIDPPIPVSGPYCDAEIPRKIHIEVPAKSDDVQFRYEQVKWNPPLPQGTYLQEQPRGLMVERVGECE